MTIFAVWVVADSGIPMYSLNLDSSFNVDSELFSAFVSAMQSFAAEIIEERVSFITLGKHTLYFQEGENHTYIVASSADSVFDSVALLNDISGFFKGFVPDGAFDLPEVLKQKIEKSIRTIVHRYTLSAARDSLNGRSILKRTLPLATLIDSPIKKAIFEKFGTAGLDLVIYCDSKFSINLLAQQVGISSEQALNIANWCKTEGLLIKTGQVSALSEHEEVSLTTDGPQPPKMELHPIQGYVKGTVSLEKAVSTILIAGIEKYNWSRVAAWWHRRRIKKNLGTIKYRYMTKILQIENIPTVESFIMEFDKRKA
ncbi:MAG: hypothetical protein ACE5OZ_04980 [Candidatus Heimdallarchaeota archaeon]